MHYAGESAFLHTVRIAKTARVNGQPMMMNQADFSILQTAILRLDVPIDGGAFQVEERADEIVIHAANWHLAFYIRHSFNIQQAEEEEKLAVYMARMPVPFGSGEGVAGPSVCTNSTMHFGTASCIPDMRCMHACLLNIKVLFPNTAQSL